MENKESKPINKKLLGGILAVATVFTVVGGFTGGYFLHKYRSENENSESIDVDPTTKGKVDISEFTLDSSGNKVGTVTSKSTDNVITNINVTIGGYVLSSSEYSYKISNNKNTSRSAIVNLDTPSSAQIKIYKSTLDAHKGAINIIPVLSIREYTIIFNPGEGATQVPVQNIKKGELATKAASEKPGFVLLGWYEKKDLSGEPFDFSTPIKKDYEFYAKWKEVEDPEDYKTVTFITGEGCSSIPSQLIRVGQYASNPGKAEYKDKTKLFDNWYTDEVGEEKFDFSFPIYEDTNVYAHYSDNIMKVTFCNEDGSTFDTKDVVYGNKVESIDAPEKTGYTFKEWTLNGIAYDFDSDVTSNISLIPTYSINQFTVTFNSDGGTDVDPINVPYNGTIEFAPKTTRDGYSFKGWTLNDNPFIFGHGEDATRVTEDIELKATWQINQCVVTYDANGGEGLSKTSDTVDYEGTISDAPTATKEGHTLEGWYDSTNKFEFGTTTVTKDITLVAKWEINTLTFTFDYCDGESSAEELTINYGDIVHPLAPSITRSGYTFDGWYTQSSGGDLFDFTQQIKENTTVYAHWSPIVAVSVSLDSHNVTFNELSSTHQLTASVKPDDALEKTVTYTSSDEMVATVDSSTGLITSVGAGSCVITVTVDNTSITDTCSVNVSIAETLTSIEILEGTALTINKGDNRSLHVSFNPSTISNKGITWESTDSTNVPVDEYGIVSVTSTATEGSTATITATSVFDTSKTSSITITVGTKATNIVIDQSSPKAHILGDTKTGTTLTATVTPTAAEDKQVNWFSLNPKIATIDNNGVVTPVAKGKAIIMASLKSDPTIYTTCSLEVIKHVTDISISKTELGMLPGEEYTLSATVTPEDATDKSITWTSSDNAVATVDSTTGKVTFIAKGTATITATANDNYGGTISKTCSVSDTFVKGINFEYDTLYTEMISGGQMDQDYVSIKYLGLQGEDRTTASGYIDSTSWTCSNPDIIELSGENGGQFKSKAVGTTTVTCTCNDGRSYSFNVQVLAHNDNLFHQNATTVYVENGKTIVGSLMITDTFNGKYINEIKLNGFQNQYSITSISLPRTIGTIGNNAFSSCTNLSSFTFRGTIAQWNAITKGTDWHSGAAFTEVHCSDGDVTL